MPLSDWLMRFWSVRLILIAFLLQLLFLDSLSAKDHFPNILILNSYHNGYAGTDDIIQGFRRSITEKFPEAKFQVEYLDSKNYSGPAYGEALFQLLTYKYKNHHLDLVFASDDYAYNLVEKNHASLFPELPVVFCGTNSFDISRLEGKNQFIGVDERPSFKETVGLIFKILPATKKVIVINDGSITGQLNGKAFRTETSDFEKQADFIYWVEQPLRGLVEKIRNLPENTAIVFLATYVKDSSGAVYDSSDALEILSAASPVPLFGGWEFLLNHGIVGGKLINLSEHGALAGQIATKMLAGEKSDLDSKLFPSPNVFMFDDIELKRFAIPDSKLPKGSIIINRPPSFYQQNKTIFFATLASILGFLVIASFIAIYTSRRRLNKAYHKQLMVEKALQKEMTFSTSLINTARLIILVMDVKGCIQMMNPYMETITGYQEAEVKGKDWFDTFLLPADHTELRAMFKKAISNIDVSGEANPIVTKDGQVLMIEWHSKTLKDDSGTVIGLLSFGIDIAERIQAEQERLELEKQLRQKYKMDSIGVMAGGMAHNFNNNLSIILGNVELSKMKMAANPEIDEYLSNAKIAILRSRDLIQQILTYSQQGAKGQTPIQLPILIDETVKLLSATMPTTINLQQRICGGSRDLTINADSSQIQECLINLCNNSMHAMEEEGDITITLDSVELQKKDIPIQYESLPGRYAKLSVQDNGCGMSAETIDQVFDLFYTTKPVDEGTGVGLSTVQGIVTKHGGLIKVNSNVGEGTTFELYFPVIAQTQSTETVPINEEMPGGTEHILFVDDDPMLASLGEQLLSTKGYTITTTTDSTEALNLFTANPDQFDMVITDQTMPELTGKELIAELKKAREDIPTIICTGFSSKVDEVTAKELGASAFLMKPLDMPKLLQTIRQVLDAGMAK